MATNEYISNRSQYGRPQAMLWSNNIGTLSNNIYTPNGYEVGAIIDDPSIDDSLLNQFIILSDHNRQTLDFTQERIQSRQRMINGNIRSYHTADKKTLSTSWTMLPSRAFKNNFAGFNDTGISDYKNTQDQYTADGGAGGLDIIRWYQDHPGPFWVFLSYDTNNTFKSVKYGEILHMYFKDFSYNVVKRGQNNFDLWNINISLEEV